MAVEIAIQTEPGPDRTRTEPRRVYDDPLRALPELYRRNGDIRLFMERASGWIMEYCHNRLSRDHDLVGDFYLHFYERADSCLQTYATRRHMPFTGFLATYLRREFFNFKRGRRGLVREFSAPEFFGEYDGSPLDYPGDPDADVLARGLPRLNALPVRDRLPLKLYFGFDLGAEELRYFVELQRCPLAASDFLKEFHARRERLRAKLARLNDRAAHLTLLIHSADDERDPRSAVRRREWKRRLDQVRGRRRSLYSLNELATLLRVNKSTVSRRIHKVIQTLRNEQESRHEN